MAVPRPASPPVLRCLLRRRRASVPLVSLQRHARLHAQRSYCCGPSSKLELKDDLLRMISLPYLSIHHPCGLLMFMSDRLRPMRTCPTLPNWRALPTPCACCDDPHPKTLALERERKPSEDEAARDGASSTCERKPSEDEAGRGSAS